MKVVINTCFGGFVISALAIKELVQMKSTAVKGITPKSYYGGDTKGWDWEETFNEDFSRDYVDIGDGFLGHKHNFNVYKDGLLWDLIDDYEDRHKLRSHPDLISVIEQMGKDAFGQCSELKIVEIPDDIEYEIDEYDGCESIHEKHRSWS